MAKIIPLRPTAKMFVELHRGVWRVSLDGTFYGDYSMRQLAISAAEEKALALRLRGRQVVLLVVSLSGGPPSAQTFEPL